MGLFARRDFNPAGPSPKPWLRFGYGRGSPSQAMIGPSSHEVQDQCQNQFLTD
jgi:hypothetical protein